ncbi:MAG: hypothetical protein V1886_04445 [archaeon]
MIKRIKKRVFGIAIAILGFILILVNAADYILNLNRISSAVSVIGLVLVAAGMALCRKKFQG